MKNSIYKAEAIDIRNIDHAAIENDITIIFRDVYIFDGTFEENLRIVNAQASHWELLAAAEAACLQNVISRLPGGWGTYLGRNGVKLSREEERQIAIARAFLKNARIVLIDNKGFEPENEKNASIAINNLYKDPHRKVIILENKSVKRESGQSNTSHGSSEDTSKEKDKQIAVETLQSIIEKIKAY